MAGYMNSIPTLNVVWPDETTSLTTVVGEVGLILPVHANGKVPKRVLITTGSALQFSFTLSAGGLVAMGGTDEGVAYHRNQGWVAVETLGNTHINTFAASVGVIHLTPLAE